eukprot:3544211-Amphidinium_carterae.2
MSRPPSSLCFRQLGLHCWPIDHSPSNVAHLLRALHRLHGRSLSAACGEREAASAETEAWTMISILTAVASDSMIAATVDRKEQELKEVQRCIGVSITLSTEFHPLQLHKGGTFNDVLQVERKQRQFMIFLRDAFYEAPIRRKP